MTHATTIVAYTYRASMVCPVCVLRMLPTGDNEQFDGWQDASVPPMSTEDNLTELAAAFGIDRFDESTFDSGDFPKVVFASMLDDDEICNECGEEL